LYYLSVSYSLGVSHVLNGLGDGLSGSGGLLHHLLLGALLPDLLNLLR
jgi:hypothetical protein